MNKYKVDMNAVKKHDSSPPYLKLLRKEIKEGGGLVEIKNRSSDKADIYAADTNNWLMGTIQVPIGALKCKNKQQ